MWRQCNRGLPWGVRRGAAPRSRCWPVVVWKGHVCVWGTPRGRGRQENVFRSPVILHDAGQIRLELTAEDIQLDCACHSVASIRAFPRAFVFAIAKKGEHCTLCLFVSLPFYVDPQLWTSSLFLLSNVEF